VRTVRHFWPELNNWLDRIPDRRFQPLVVYHKRFLVWWGLSLYLFQLGARRQLDFDFDCRDSDILLNFNRLAKTKQNTRPATKGGRHRWHIENQGFNRQKNSGLNLEHAYCTNPELLKAYYYLMQIAHLILQVFEAGSLLRRLAAECGRTPWQLFGGLKNLARRLLESFRYRVLSDEAFDPDPNERIQIRFDSS
jgi:hypothetical protein